MAEHDKIDARMILDADDEHVLRVQTCGAVCRVTEVYCDLWIDSGGEQRAQWRSADTVEVPCTMAELMREIRAATGIEWEEGDCTMNAAEWSCVLDRLNLGQGDNGNGIELQVFLQRAGQECEGGGNVPF